MATCRWSPGIVPRLVAETWRRRRRRLQEVDYVYVAAVVVVTAGRGMVGSGQPVHASARRSEVIRTVESADA